MSQKLNKEKRYFKNYRTKARYVGSLSIQYILKGGNNE
jgi:hypothetical protein